MKELAIYGAGGLGLEVACIVEAINDDIPTWDLKGFFDDGIEKGAKVKDYPVLGSKQEASTFEGFLVVAIGDPKVKKSILGSMNNVKYATLIHPKAEIMGADVKIGVGTIITCGVVLTTNINIENHVLLNLNSTVGHNSRISNFSSVMCGVNIAGDVSVGEAVMIGSGANILNGVVLGNNAKIGAGSVVNKNINPNKTAVGVPARELNE